MKAKLKYFFGFIVFTFSIAAFPYVSDSTPITNTYNNLKRFTKVIFGDRTTEEFTYDTAGNRLTHIVKDNIQPTVSILINIGNSYFS